VLLKYQTDIEKVADAYTGPDPIEPPVA
jgi:hypothetical protein